MEISLESLKNLSILCVEDEAGIRTRLVKTLAYYFGEVYEASHALEGLEIYTRHHPDLIMSDIQMNAMSGIELVEEIRKNDKQTPIIMLTAHNKEEYLMELINLKIDHFILKPANADRLLEGIMCALEGKLLGKVSLGCNLLFSPLERKLYLHDEEIRLNKREKKFLLLLLQNQKKITTYTQIEDRIWDEK